MQVLARNLFSTASHFAPAMSRGFATFIHKPSDKEVVFEHNLSSLSLSRFQSGSFQRVNIGEYFLQTGTGGRVAPNLLIDDLQLHHGRSVKLSDDLQKGVLKQGFPAPSTYAKKGDPELTKETAIKFLHGLGIDSPSLDQLKWAYAFLYTNGVTKEPKAKVYQQAELVYPRSSEAIGLKKNPADTLEVGTKISQSGHKLHTFLINSKILAELGAETIDVEVACRQMEALGAPKHRYDVKGEYIVMHHLPSEAISGSYATSDFSSEDQQILTELAKFPQGMVFQVFRTADNVFIKPVAVSKD